MTNIIFVFYVYKKVSKQLLSMLKIMISKIFMLRYESYMPFIFSKWGIVMVNKYEIPLSIKFIVIIMSHIERRSKNFT